ncbi:histidine kinase [Bacillus cereus group sp. N21]|nr:histidine kinase [Bacillus cereus group sp. N21]
MAHAREEGLEEGLEKGIQKGLQKGIQKGREEGIEQGKVQLICGMHKNGMPLEDIAKFTGLSTEEIRKLLL